jgi:hypothetical protein
MHLSSSIVECAKVGEVRQCAWGLCWTGWTVLDWLDCVGLCWTGWTVLDWLDCVGQ